MGTQRCPKLAQGHSEIKGKQGIKHTLPTFPLTSPLKTGPGLQPNVGSHCLAAVEKNWTLSCRLEPQAPAFLVPHILDTLRHRHLCPAGIRDQPASLWASPSHSQPGLMPPRNPHPALPRGSQEPEGMGRWVWTHLGPGTVANPSDLCHVPVPILPLQGGHCYCLAPPWELLACSESESTVQSAVCMLPFLSSQSLGPHPSTHPQSESPALRSPQESSERGWGEGGPSQRESGWAPPPLGPEAQATPTPRLQCLLSREHLLQGTHMFMAVVGQAVIRTPVHPTVSPWSHQMAKPTPGVSHT
ncbi:uncharacterized protein LOC132214791 [Myotis daubentonii]|uniref:uncharacterized protein LOC132214791 n=1 Tax=Myotis daubentonii TaxID=98922 RepID=UPI002873C612|nr:uncharacterized protein LOC132214791 [Myotis daubentonii]